MSISLNDVIAILARAAGPVTPFFGLDDMAAERSELIANSSRELEDILFKLLQNPPDSSTLQCATQEDFKFELCGILSEIGRKDSSRFLELLKPFLDDPKTRPMAIEIVGGLQDKKGIALLEPFLSIDTLSENERELLACSLGEIGGKNAAEILKNMKKNYSQQGHRIAEEIDIALSNIRQP